MTHLKKLTSLMHQLPESWIRFAILALTALFITVVINLFRYTVTDLSIHGPGDIARRNVQASRDYLIEDTISTEERRAAAAAEVKPVFVLNDTQDGDVSLQLNALLQAFRSNVGASTEVVSQDAMLQFERKFRLNLEGGEWKVLRDAARWPAIDAAVRKLVQPILQHGVVASKEIFRTLSAKNGAVLRSATSGKESQLTAGSDYYDLREATQVFETSFPSGGFGFGADFDLVVHKLGALFLRPNIIFDSERTEEIRAAIRAEVDPIFYQVRRGEMIVRAHDRISPVQYLKLTRLFELESSSNNPRALIGCFILSLFILGAVYLFTAQTWQTFRPSARDLALISLTLLVSFTLLQVFSVQGQALSLFFPELSPEVFLLAAPIAAGGILLEVTLSTASVVFFLVCFALIAGVFQDPSWELLLLIVLGNMVGVLSVRDCCRRSVFIRAGVKIAAANLIVTACFLFIVEQVSITDYSVRLFCAILGGITSGVFAAGLTPIVEFLGSYLTDIKLLELASLDHPLLRELSLQAPGTWNHSMVLGQMGESAAEAIGAQSLLTRVGAYYHDIGKSKKPAYFVENQGAGENRHDKLTPSMSALIIRAHVKDGIEMARQHKLPPALIDFISQHHGTALIEYFFEKAAKEAEPEEKVDETLYRYPGPKPQTKETGILMLGDGVEAASRTLSDPTPARIQGLVQKIINKVFVSGQLDECELTLRDLHEIAKSFTRVLTGIYHRRIEYSEPAEKRNLRALESVSPREPYDLEVSAQVNGNGEVNGNGRRVASEASGCERSKETPEEKSTSGGSKDTLKRLGM